MPRRKKNSNLQRRERNKELKRQARRKAKDDSDMLTKSDSNGLNFPKKAENGLNFPKKAENGLNFPKKAENGLNFPKKSENGLNFPKKSENGLNFPKKSETAENDMPVAAKCFADSVAKLCTDSDAKTYATDVAQSFTESSLNFAKCFPKECLNVCCDFDETFADAYQNDVAYINCTTYKNLSLNEEAIIQNSDIEMIEPDLEIEVISYNSPCSERFIEDMDTEKPLLLQSNSLLWNAEQIIFGSFNQNDNRFLDQSRGFQCTCNALCMLVCEEIQNSSELDKILYAGDALYNTTVNSLKAQGKFVKSLLSLEEIPDTLEFETVNFLVEKQPITCGTLVSTFENQALPSLHCAIETAFTKSTSVLLISGAVCSAVHKRNNLYIFFDSHSHGEDCLSSSDGTSILMSFSCLEDLIAYLYAFYEIMRIDLTMQFDLLPISVRKKVHFCTQEKPSENLLEAYFYDQTLRQKQKATKKSELILNAKKKKNRKEYYRIYMQNIRQQNSKFKAKELVAQRKFKQNVRQDRGYKAKELVAQRKSKQNARQEKHFKAKELVAQRKSKQNARQDRHYKAKELVAQRKSKQNARQDRHYKAKELVDQRKSKQNARQDRHYKAK